MPKCRRRVRKNPDGSRNQKDMDHNRKCEENMLIDNPWMNSVLKKNKPTGYDKYLKNLVKNRIKTLKKKSSKKLKKKSKKTRKKRKERKIKIKYN